VWTGDIATGQDALAADRYGPIDRIGSDAAAVIITNPPWSRPAMHALSHLQNCSSTLNYRL
jgi:hypothetical protein